MAKDKGSFKPEDLKKYYFWIVLPILVLLAIAFTFIAKSKIKKAYVEKTTAISAAKDGADSVANDSKHPNDNTIKEIQAETKVLADNVFKAWTLMYDDQKLRNRWPRQLSREFLDLVENKLKFRDPIGVGKPYLLEDYGYFIGRHLPDLLKEMNRRRCQVQDYKLLKKAEMNMLGMTDDERFWPVYVDHDGEGNEFLYIGIHSNKDDETSPLSEVYLYNRAQDVVAKVDDQALRDSLLKKETHEHYYLDVDPWILTPKDMIMFGVQTSDLSSIMSAISGGGAGGGASGGGGLGAMSPMGGAGGPGGGASGGASGGGSARGDMLGGAGGGLAGLGIGNIPGDGYDPAEEQVSGTTLEELGGGGLGGGMTGGGRVGGGAMGGGAMGGGRSSGRMGGGMAGGGMPGGGAMGGGRSSGRSSGRMGGGAMAGGGMMSGDMSGASVEDPSWSQKIYPGLPPYKERRRIIGNVDWPDPEIYSLPTWEEDVSHPESIEVWYAQETLWVYEALIRVIAETNKEYPDNISKAPVKCVEQMLIGQNAAVEWLTLSETIGDLLGTSATMSGGLMSSSSEMMMSSSSAMTGSMEMGGLALTGNAEEQALTKILTGRYIGEDGTPLKADDKPPFAEFNKMPVCLKLAMDQRRIPDLLVSCANSAMPIDVKHVRVCPDNNVPFTMPIPLENQSSEGSSSGMMGMVGGLGGVMPGGAGGIEGGGSGSGRGAMDGTGMGAGMDVGGVDVGRSDLSQSEYGVDTIRVEIFGVINIYNEPNQANFATGASAEEADAEAEAILSGTEPGATEGAEEGAESAPESTDGTTTLAATDESAAPATPAATPATTDESAAPTEAPTPAPATTTEPTPDAAAENGEE